MTKCVLPKKSGIIGFMLMLGIVLGFTPQLEAVGTYEWMSSPDWKIGITDHGYSDLLYDMRPGYEAREYLSGEWGAAVGYTKGGVTNDPIWLEPFFEYPDWTTNSNFSVVNSIAGTGVVNSDGFEIFTSTIMNPDLLIEMTYEIINTGGIEQGLSPASSPDAGTSITSNPYVFNQKYTITNISGEAITDLQMFQFLHGYTSDIGLYDDRNYGGAFGEYQYDTTLIGESWGINNNTGELVAHTDYLTLHSQIAPSAQEVGAYGVGSVDSHGWGKPSTGVHLSVEANALNGTDYFYPIAENWGEETWVSGAQRYDLINLGIGETTSFDVMLSLHTETNVIIDPNAVPEPGTLLLLGFGLVGLVGLKRKKYLSR